MGIGRASGKNRAEVAARMAINSPLLETSIDGARSVLLSITGDKKLGLHEASVPPTIIDESVDEDAYMIYGTAINDDLEDEIIVTVIATGFEKEFTVINGNEQAGQEIKEKNPSLSKISDTLDKDDPIDLPIFLKNRNKNVK